MRASTLLLLPLLAACASAPPPVVDAVRLSRRIDELAVDAGAPELAVWVGAPYGDADLRRDDTLILPAASAIKTAFLIELFAAHAQTLDRPMPGLEAVLADDRHAAIAHFAPATRDLIRRELAGMSVRQLGAAMIRGHGVSNASYNAAANIVIAHFGGPAALTARIHARAPEFAGLAVRRYMLATRDSGDNEATAQSLAAVLQRIARSELRGVGDATVDAMRDVLSERFVGEGERRYSKTGALDSAPAVRITSGWIERGEQALVYVVMASHAQAGGEPLERLVHAVVELLLQEAFVPR